MLELPPLADLRRRRSAKWRLYGEDVLPLWVAELDVGLAPSVRDVLAQAVRDGDTGYSWPWDLAPAFARFAARRWDWAVEPTWCHPVPDVMAGVGEVLELLTDPGDGVVICPPVYPPFFQAPGLVRRTVVEVPLAGADLDLPGIDAALAAGARAVLLCSPHNPLGRVWSATELDDLDEMVRRHDAVVLSDEIHAPLTLPGAEFTPYLRGRERQAVALVSASKAFNLAGLKAALIVAGSERVQARLATRPMELAHRAGHFGVLAGIAAYDDGDAWLSHLLRHLDAMRGLLGTLLPAGARWTPPAAGYLAWLDLGRPAVDLLRTGVALSDGADFGSPGWVRLNFGTSAEILTEALRRLDS